MDLTPQTLREVEFREKLRGYHPDDVDDFLEEVAVALDGLLARLYAAETGGPPLRADLPTVGKEGEAPRPPGEGVNDDTLRRTLLLAQRTADLAVAEAEESARKLLEQARQEAGRLVAEAEAQVASVSKEARARAEASITDLEQRRAALEREVASLQNWASQQRDRLRDVLSDQIRALDVWLATSGTPRPGRAPTPASAGSIASRPGEPPAAGGPSSSGGAAHERAARPGGDGGEPVAAPPAPGPRPSSGSAPGPAGGGPVPGTAPGPSGPGPRLGSGPAGSLRGPSTPSGRDVPFGANGRNDERGAGPAPLAGTSPNRSGDAAGSAVGAPFDQDGESGGRPDSEEPGGAGGRTIRRR
ncbi:MAG TPA: DivIVA domain-containing protein [Acidimicrobiales bacterium]